ncbi:MAG TPA: hypothetical protein VE442_10890 [Jatrophihabitans sp.]|jgi:hypothetical protein|nr:hypothetical protein [Jatrophihabitans sp.]
MEPSRQEPGLARTGPIAIAALLTELVVIGVASNQWVTKRIFRQLVEGGDTFGLKGLKASLLTYNWRFAPQADDTTHIWLSQMMMILTLVVVSAVLIVVVVRGPATFARALFTCWMAVIAGTMLGSWVRGLVEDTPGDSLRITKAVFGQTAPGAVSFFASAVLGLVVGVIAGLFAVATRRPAVQPEAPEPVREAPAYVPPDPPPYYGGPPGTTTRLPTLDAPPEPTTRLPDAAAPPVPQSTQPDHATTRFPRPPDDYRIEEH